MTKLFDLFSTKKNIKKDYSLVRTNLINNQTRLNIFILKAKKQKFET
jgi:hypothetical protein